MFIDFLIATKREAKQIACDENPTTRWPGVSRNGLTCLDVATLFGLMIGETDPEEVVDLEDGFETLSAEDDESTEVRVFPTAFVRALGATKPAEVSSLAERWRADEGGVSAWEQAEAVDLVSELCELARKAVAARKPILLCVRGF